MPAYPPQPPLHGSKARPSNPDCSSPRLETPPPLPTRQKYPQKGKGDRFWLPFESSRGKLGTVPAADVKVPRGTAARGGPQKAGVRKEEGEVLVNGQWRPAAAREGSRGWDMRKVLLRSTLNGGRCRCVRSGTAFQRGSSRCQGEEVKK